MQIQVGGRTSDFMINLCQLNQLNHHCFLQHPVDPPGNLAITTPLTIQGTSDFVLFVMAQYAQPGSSQWSPKHHMATESSFNESFSHYKVLLLWSYQVLFVLWVAICLFWRESPNQLRQDSTSTRFTCFTHAYMLPETCLNQSQQTVDLHPKSWNRLSYLAGPQEFTNLRQGYFGGVAHLYIYNII